MNKTLTTIIIAIILAAAIFFIWYSIAAKVPAQPVEIPDGIIFFYGEECKYCKKVEDFVAQNKIEDKVKFTSLEVWSNKDNQTILAEVLPMCGISANEVGVPFLYDGNGRCYVGDVDIINYFKNATGIK
jgi:hypothetical protein